MELMQEKEFSFPFVKDYEDKNQISKIFPKLLNINNPNYIENNKIDLAYFVILKSTNDDDLHKAIKYGIWTSSNSDNKNLSNLWNESNKNGKNIPIYLIYQVESSRFFMGIAKMMSDFDKAKSFKYWWEPCKWFGLFKIEWIFIKDVHYKIFQLFKYNIKSGTDIPFEKGMEILEIFQNYPLKKSIFDCFPFYDQRENIIREERDNDLLFLKTFDSLSKTYSCDPELLLDRPIKYLGKNNNYGEEYDNQYKYYNQYDNKYDNKNYYNSDNNNFKHNNNFKKKPFFKIKEFYPTNDANFALNFFDQLNNNEKEKILNEETKISDQTVSNKYENKEIKTNENNKELFNETTKENNIENNEIKINEINNELINESKIENNKEQNEKHANFSEKNLEKKNHKTYQKTPYLKNPYNGFNGKNKNYSYKKPSQNNYEIIYIPKEEK